MKNQNHASFTPGQRGLTLIEVMIAMVLGILLLLGISSMFMSNKRIYKEQESMSRLQENARFAIDMLMYDIRMAGYTGCNNDMGQVVNHLTGAANDDSMYSFANAIEGSESKADWVPSGSTDIVDDADADHADDSSMVVAATDAITVRYLEPTGIKLSTAMTGNTVNLSVPGPGDLADGDIIAVSDCGSTDIMQLSAAPTTSLQHAVGDTAPPPGNATNALQKLYGTDAEISTYISRRYYIGAGTGNTPSLYRVTNGGAPQELIEGVQQMQILYGEDTSGDMIADTYVNAANVASWINVVSIRLALLFVTADENFQIEPDTKTHTLLGGAGAGGATVAAANDFHRRRVFTTTIQIRNRS
jgi:type IV pilus assembly protein PilW